MYRKKFVLELLCDEQLCSENGQFCAIKEVQVISDDPHSKERLKQLNQVTWFLKSASLVIFLSMVIVFALPIKLTQQHVIHFHIGRRLIFLSNHHTQTLCNTMEVRW
jgi:hypothetical protein